MSAHTSSEDRLDREVRFLVYATFADTGRAPETAELAARLDVSPDEVQVALERLERARALALTPATRRIWMAHPFSAAPSDYRVWIGGKEFWANCAWDALALPALLGCEAEIHATCADCAEPMALTVGPHGPGESAAFVHFVVAPRRFWENVGFT